MVQKFAENQFLCVILYVSGIFFSMFYFLNSGYMYMHIKTERGISIWYNNLSIYMYMYYGVHKTCMV